MTILDPTSFANVDPAQFAAMVKGASKDELQELITGEHRKTVLDAIFERFPSQFRADRAGSTSAVIHWTITGRSDGGSDTYELVIADGACTLSPAPAAEPKLAVTTGGVEFLQLVTGNANPMSMFMTGKLKAKGDMALAANLAKLFNLPS